MLEIREKADHLTGEMESLKTDILLFRKGLEHYEAGLWMNVGSFVRSFWKNIPVIPA